MNLEALYKLGYGLYVVSSRRGDRFNGQIANTVFQVTSELTSKLHRWWLLNMTVLLRKLKTLT